MTPENTDLVAALTILRRQIPSVCLAMTQGQLSPEKQAQFGELLIQLGQLIQQHTPDQTTPNHIGQTTSRQAARPLLTPAHRP